MMSFQADEQFGMSSGHFDSIFLGRGVAHAGDWKRQGTELLRVLRSGRRMVLAEISFSKPPTGTSRTSPRRAMRWTTSRRSTGEASICSRGGSRDA
jgi:hypothetical protein